MKTKIRNFLASIKTQNYEKTQVFLASISMLDLRAFVIYILFKRKHTELLTLSQLVSIWKEVGLGGGERIEIWGFVKERAWSFDKKAFVWLQLSSSEKESNEELELFEELKQMSQTSKKTRFYRTAWIYVQTQERSWWEQAELYANSMEENVWMLESMHSFFNSWHDEGSEWKREEYEETKTSLESFIKEQIELGEKEFIGEEREIACKIVGDKIDAIVFVPKDDMFRIPIAKQESVQLQNRSDQGADKPMVSDSEFNQTVNLWSEADSDSLAESQLFDKIKTLADTFDRELFVWINEKVGSPGEKESLNRLKKRNKTLRQKLFLLDKLEGDEKEQLWLEIESSTQLIDDAIMVWIRAEKIVERRKKAWVLVKQGLIDFSKSISLWDNPPVNFTAKERKDLWVLSVKTADKIEEKAWVWIRAKGKTKETVYLSIIDMIEC